MKLDSLLADLARQIAQLHRAEGEVVTPIPGLSLYRRAQTVPTAFRVYEPGLAVIAQGMKEVSYRGRSIRYGKSRFLLTSVDMPLSSRVLNATSKSPGLSLFLKLDMLELREVLMESQFSIRASGTGEDRAGVVTGPNTEELLGALIRLLKLLESPDDIHVMAKLIKKEILYRLLQTEQGSRLRQLAMVGSGDNGVWKAIEWLKTHFTERFDLKELARATAMGISTLHHHFKKMTAMSPLQYQKMLRLYEARRLLMAGTSDAGTAGFRVGYESQSQFNREYKRLFGKPPIRDVKSLKR